MISSLGIKPRLFLALVVLLAAAVDSAGPANASALDARRTEQIDSILTRALAAGPIPGIGVAIERGGQIVYQKGFGFADLENKVPVTAATVFPIGSITKTMTGLVINQLVARGQVDLDAPAGRYLPKLPAPVHDVKVRYLLDHTSGIDGYTDIPGFPMRSQDPITREQVLGWFATRPLEFPSGTRWSYTNSGQYLLGLIIEAVTGGTYAAYLEKNVFAPFGMQHSSITGWESLIDHRAHGYHNAGSGRAGSGFQNAQRYDPLVPFAAGAILSTTGDLIQYRRGVFASDPASRAMLSRLLRTDRLPDGTELPYSLGSLVLTKFEGHRRIGHPGDVFGFSAQYSYYPDDDTTIVILTNTQNAVFPPISTEQKIARVLFDRPQPNVVDAKLPTDLAAQYSGEYQVGDFRFGFDRLAFNVRDGVLRLQFGPDPASAIPLRYQGGTRFISSLDDEQSIEFFPNSAATITFYGWPVPLHRVSTTQHGNP